MNASPAKTVEERTRCGWPGADPLMIAYHDDEWGTPTHDDGQHFEYIVLDSFQAGLSWRTILHKRENFRAAFADFDPERVARFGKRDVERLMRDVGIVRNRQKIEATIGNARAFLELRVAEGGFDRFIWGFTGGVTLRNAWASEQEVPPRTPESDAMSRALKERGFRFVGSTICYAYMQAAGMVDDHVVSCFRHGAGS
ncbi:MAG TPA: DNA-3-methyladenine glycosylase I [Longimicrobiales bacterium]|nr:DNA-3-methyladenine glycosylase I [Longimicrobiales bacterium]